MSEFIVDVVKVGKITKHPNADSLSIAKIFDYDVIIRTGEYSEGQLAVYIPVDSIVPDTEQWRFLAPKDAELGTSLPARYRRIKAKRLRGIFSQGMLAKLPQENLTEGTNVQELMGITKWDPEEEKLSTGGDCEIGPEKFEFVKYTDIESLKRNSGILQEGENVVLTEKLHGACFRAVHDGERLWVGSRKQIKKDVEGSVFWLAAKQAQLTEKLAKHPNIIFFGEVYGSVQDLKYDVKGVHFRCFDTFDTKLMKYNDWCETAKLCSELDIPLVPILYEGPWNNDLKSFAEGNSTLAKHVREGFVVKPLRERYHRNVGRVILKLVGEGYLLR